MTTHVQPNLPNWITRLNGYHFFLIPFTHSVEYKPRISGYSQSGPSAIHLSRTAISILTAFSRRSQIDPFLFCFNSPHVPKKGPLRISALEQVFVILYEPHKLLITLTKDRCKLKMTNINDTAGGHIILVASCPRRGQAMTLDESIVQGEKEPANSSLKCWSKTSLIKFKLSRSQNFVTSKFRNGQY